MSQRAEPRTLPAHKNLLLVGGAVLIALGAGNWLIGASRSEPYVEYLRRHPGPAVERTSLKAELLEPADEQREERDVTRAKLEFYQLVQSGGRLMVLVGALLLLAGGFRNGLLADERPWSPGPGEGES